MSNPLFPHAPRGVNLPISCTYQYSFGKEIHDEADIPAGWEIEWIAGDSDEPKEAGFEVAAIYIVTTDEGTAFGTFDPHAGGTITGYAFLRDAEGKLVATWDEGRWWTPEESAAFRLMLQVPAAYTIAEGIKQSDMPRWMRRRKK